MRGWTAYWKHALAAIALVGAGAGLKTGYDGAQHVAVDHLDAHIAAGVIAELVRRDPSLVPIVEQVLRERGITITAAQAPAAGEVPAPPENVRTVEEDQEEENP